MSKDKFTKREILGQIKDNFSEYSTRIKNFTKGLAKMTLGSYASFYAFPTVARHYEKFFLNAREEDEFWGQTFGLFTGPSAILLTATVPLISGHPQFYLIPLTTNTLSTIYETGRFLVGDAKKKLMMKSDNLESRIS